MRWIALFLLFLVACTLPQPDANDTSLDVKEENKPEVVVEETVVETAVIETNKTNRTPVNSTEEITEVVDETESSPVTGGVTAIDEEFAQKAYIGQPPEKETLAVGINNVMDYLIETFSNVQSYSFIIESGKVFVRGDKFKIALENPLRHLSIDKNTNARSQDVITTIYIDRKDKTAMGYCEGKDVKDGIRYECQKKDILDIPRVRNFNEFNLKLPEDWLWDMLEVEPVRVEADKYYVNSKKVIRVAFEKGDVPYDMFFDEKTGLPVRIISEEEGIPVTYDFLDLSVNSVKENDVIHRDLDTIPSEEYFI